MIEIKTPVFPESVADGEIAAWHVQVGEGVNRDQILVDIETDKVVLEVVAPSDGKVTEILKAEGETVLAEEVLAMFEAGEVAEKATEADLETITDTPEVDSLDEATASASPAARKIAEEQKLDVTSIVGTGKGNRVTKEDVLKAVAAAEGQMQVTSAVSAPVEVPVAGDRIERRVPMTRLRASVARRLLEAQETAAMLTTFNEVDMTAIIELRSQYKDDFAKIHNGTRLGFMSFFVRASIEALKRFPAVNASIDGNDIVYHGYQDIGVAVGSPRGLVVPVLRDADSLTLAEIETQVSDYGRKAQDNKLSIDDMTGGTFTISNGGVFGSLLSTPILNPPQTGILGMHKIDNRPIAVDDQIEIRPMMYLALSYDHRVIDGREAVTFLVRVKECIENPERIMLGV